MNVGISGGHCRTKGLFDLFMSPQDRGNIFCQEKGSSRFGLPLGTCSVSLDLSTKRRRC